ncbi:MAG: hypothetical protein H0U96_06810 [Acidobacteria bacterium]|nr:hypothetical protein [Acidobacteriota bacterium]
MSKHWSANLKKSINISNAPRGLSIRYAVRLGRPRHGLPLTLRRALRFA